MYNIEDLREELNKSIQTKEQIKDLLIDKGASFSDTDDFSTYPSKIDSISSSNDLVEKEVNFYDYDGTLLYSYNPQEALALTELPAAPDRTSEGLTFQNWNWSLENIKEYVEDYGYCDIGAVYTPTDGYTHIFIALRSPNYLTVNLQYTYSYNLEIDWGDGTITEDNKHTHTYSQIGEYEIILKNSLQLSLSHKPTNSDVLNRTAVYKIYFGNNISLNGVSNYTLFDDMYSIKKMVISEGAIKTSNYAIFRANYNLEYLVLPKSIIDLTNCFDSYYCTKKIITSESCPSLSGYSNRNIKSIFANKDELANNNRYYNMNDLKRIFIPNDIQSIGNYNINTDYGLTDIIFSNKPFNNVTIGNNFCGNCEILQNVSLPEGIITLGTYFCNQSKILQKVVIPSTITSIGNNFCYNCYNLKEVYFKSTTPPTLGGTSNFASSYLNLIIYVPYSEDHSILEAYKSSTNWSDYAGLMQEYDYENNEII